MEDVRMRWLVVPRRCCCYSEIAISIITSINYVSSHASVIITSWSLIKYMAYLCRIWIIMSSEQVGFVVVAELLLWHWDNVNHLNESLLKSNSNSEWEFRNWKPVQELLCIILNLKLPMLSLVSLTLKSYYNYMVGYGQQRTCYYVNVIVLKY